MYTGQDPKWLSFLSPRMRWLTIPNLAIVFVVIQAAGFLLVASTPGFSEQLALLPDLVLQGQIWRVLSFLAMPLSYSLIGILFSLAFAYFILNSIENEWGSFKTTFYVLSSVLLTILFSLVFDYPVVSVRGFVSTWFLAAAALFPEQQIQIYFFIPVKMKYLGWIALAFAVLQFLQGAWMDRFYLLTIYANYLIFFGPYVFNRLKQWQRQRRYRAHWR